MCQRLGIRIIAANSPQAKGRVERNHGTHQDRLVKKMRLKKIKTHAEANLFLEQEYLPEHNRRFRRNPAQPEDYHRAAPRAAELEDAFFIWKPCEIRDRQRLGGAARQPLLPGESLKPGIACRRPKGKVTVCEWEDGRLQIRYRDRAVSWEEIPGPVPAQAVRPREAKAKKQKPLTPKADHPWRQAYRKMQRPWSKPGTAAPVSLIHEMSG